MGLASLSVFGSAETNTLKNVVANKPETAVDWSTDANWSLGHVPVDGSYVKFPAITSPYYVRLADDVKIGWLSSDNTSVRTIGERVVMTSAQLNITKRVSNGWLFADIYVTDVDSAVAEKELWFDADASICGRIISQGRHVVPAGGTLYHRLDRYATSPNPLRTDDLQITQPASGNTVGIYPGNASFALYVEGAAASTTAWRQVAGSPFIEQVDRPMRVAAVGAAVTGPGVPAGTYVRRRLSESQYLELSQPVTESFASNKLSFAAFNPDVRCHVALYDRQGTDSSSLKICRGMAQDRVRFEIDLLRMNGNDHVWIYGVPASESSWLPGTLVLHNIEGGNPKKETDRLRNCHIEFAGTTAGGPTTFGARRNVAFYEAACTARMTVTNNLVGVINSFTNFTGTLVKDGAGTLRIGLADAVNTGSITVEAGTLELTAPASVSASGVSFKNLSVAAGARLKIPTEGFTATSVTFAEGATLVGPGRLVVNGPRTVTPVLADGATIEYRYSDAGAYVHDPQAKVAGHPAFWVDASQTSTMTLVQEANGTKTVARWNDCRPGEPMFCTNVVRRPTLFTGDAMKDKFVKIAYVDTHWYTNSEGLVWSTPIGGIKAVFMVQDPSDGGGEVLGATSRLRYSSYFGSQGGPYYRGSNAGRTSSIVSASYATDCVKYGRFFLDGEEFCGYEKGYFKGAVLQLLEHHVNTNLMANASRRDLFCDAFGTGGYLDGHAYAACNGRQRLSEVIIYTNALTHAERVETALYLSRKWLGRDIVYTDVDAKASVDAMAPAAGEVISVADGAALGVARVEGGAVVEKTGAGRLVVNSLDAGRVAVAGGELLVKSLSLDSANVPAGALVHVDASDATSLETTVSGGATNLVKWHSRGTTDDSTVRPFSGTPRVVPNVLNGRSVVDCGVMNGADKAAMQLYKADGTTYEHVNAYSTSKYLVIEPLRAVFAVFGSKGGGNSILGCYGSGYPWQGLAHRPYQKGLPMFTANTHEGQSTSTGAWYYGAWGADDCWAVSNGVRRLNGVTFDPFATPFSGGYDQLTLQFALHSDSSRRIIRGADFFATYGQGTSYVGGLEYAEIAVYTNLLSDAQIDATEAYLAKKWFDRDTSGYRVATCDALTIDAGASVRVVDWSATLGANAYGTDFGVLTTGELGGGGTVAGHLALAANGKILARVNAAGTVFETLTVTGSVDLSRGAVVEIVGETANVATGSYPILVCAGLQAASVGTLVPPASTTRRTFSVQVVDGVVRLRVSGKGTHLFLR